MPKTAVVKDMKTDQIYNVYVETGDGFDIYAGSKELAEEEARINGGLATVTDILGSGFSYYTTELRDMTDAEIAKLTKGLVKAEVRR